MATQSFVSGMPSLNSGCNVQQATTNSQQQKQNSSSQTSNGKHSQPNGQVVSSPSTTNSSPQGSVSTQVNVVAHTANQQESPQHQPAQSPQATQSVVQTTATAGPTTQFIAVAVSDEDSPGQTAVSLTPGHHTYVHYVDGGADATSLYSTANGQMAGYSVYNVTDSATMYTPGTATYYSTGSGTAVSYSQVNSNASQGVTIQGQLLSHQGGGTYLVQGSPIDGDGASHTLARSSPATDEIGKAPADILSSYSNDQCVIQTLHGTHEGATQLQALAVASTQQQQQQSQQQQSTATTTTTTTTATQHSQQQNVRDMDIIHVQWLIDNYETAEGVSLPRSTLYNHYLRHCKEHKLEPVNAASFGKLIRSVFLGLRTRRLGTRGNSKYHYYGIRVKPTSPLNQISTEESGSSLRQTGSQTKKYKSSSLTKAELNDSNSDTGNSTSGAPSSDSPHPVPTPIQPTPQQQQHQQYLGDATAAMPALVELEYDPSLIPEGITDDDLDAFRTLYRDFCESFLEAVVGLQFSLVEQLWQVFWRAPGGHGHSQNEQEKVLSKSKLYILCKYEPVLRFVRKADYQFYQNLVDVLIPDVLRPIPSSLTQAIRNFAKSLEGWLTSAMNGCPNEMLKIKISSVSAFAQTLRRYTSLNHLAQAARAVLQNSLQINQMLADLNRVDFHNVQEQASWVCQCEDGMVQRLEQDFKLTLQQQNSLEQWAAWLDGVVTLVLLPHQGKPDFPKAARQFLLKWSFYSSMVIRDLTLRSAASFGSFHLIRLLYDEYMFYLIEHKVAKATGETPIAVMGEFIGLGSRLFTTKDSLTDGNQKLTLALSSPGRNIVIENGDSSSAGGSLVSGGQSTSFSGTNGMLDGATSGGLSSLQQGLIGQPAVCIGNNNELSAMGTTISNASSVENNSLQPMLKKMKAA